MNRYTKYRYSTQVLNLLGYLRIIRFCPYDFKVFPVIIVYFVRTIPAQCSSLHGVIHNIRSEKGYIGRRRENLPTLHPNYAYVQELLFLINLKALRYREMYTVVQE